MPYYQSLREYMETLEAKDKLLRIPAAVRQETEVCPLYWLQLRGLPEDKLKCFLYEVVIDAKGEKKHRVSLGHYDASREIMALGLMCSSAEINEKWCYAYTHPVEPQIISEGPVQEVIISGSELDKVGLGILPSPVENPGYSGDIRTTNQFITKDPDTGIRNVGTYSGHISGPRSMRWGLSPSHHGNIHIQKARARGSKLEVAIAVGNTPNVVLAATAPLPYGMDELTVAGGLAGEPVKLVKCKTIDLEVPANAEIVIEGEISNDYMEPKAAFGDYPGYICEVENAYAPVIEVKCITHRHNPIFTATTVGFPIPGGSVLGSVSNEVMLYQHLKYQCYIPGIQDVVAKIGSDVLIIQVKKDAPWQPWQVLNAVAGYTPYMGKVTMVVDEDIDPRDDHLLFWALAYRMQPHRDVRVVTHRVPKLDPSIIPPGAKMAERSFPPPSGASAMLIDATRKWAYTPVGLPKKEFMDRALKLWQEGGFPELKLRKPWYGYPLGLWTERDEENARLTVQGEHFKLGEEFKKRRKRIISSSND